MSHPVFCVDCGSNCCEHLQRSRKTLLTPREVDVIRAVCNPDHDGQAQMAFAIGVTRGSFNVYQMRIYKKLGWKSGNAVRLALWAMAHREELQIAIPEKTAFAAAQKP